MRTFFTILAIAVGHFVLMLGLLAYGLTSHFENFDRPEKAWFLSDAAGFAFEVLAQPGWTILHWLPAAMSSSCEFFILTANSMLWGCGIVFFFNCVRVANWIFSSEP